MRSTGWGSTRQGACIYADNPAVFDEDFAKIPELAKHDIPCSTSSHEDFVLQRHTLVVERMYHQLGGSITRVMKEGVAITRTVSKTRRRSRTGSRAHAFGRANRPAFADSTLQQVALTTASKFLHLLKKEDTYATVRGPVRSLVRSL